jgi:hypothetical protein
MYKRGQFFLIAAIVIISILIGLVSIQNYSASNQEETYVYDFSEEFDFESAQLINSVKYNAEGDINKEISDLINSYLTQTTEDNLLFIFLYKESATNFKSTIYGCPQSSTSLGNTGTSTCNYGPVGDSINYQIESATTIIKVNLGIEDIINPKFDITTGENLYFVVIKQGDEVNVGGDT